LEAYQAVRTALYARTRTEGVKVLQITSPDPGDGSALVAANLAASVAQSGRKVLLIDADFRSVRPEKNGHAPLSPGLSTVLYGRAAAADVIRPGGVERLSVLPRGPVPPNPTELLASPRLRALLAAAAAEYDFVFIDSPPLLAFTDPMVVAAEAEGVLLALRLSKNGRPRAEQAKGILEAAGARVLGVVVHGQEGGPRGGRTDGQRSQVTRR
jgi:capsular exopolysaccharide synthesis family protein